MNISAVVQRFDTGPTEELAPALTDALEDIERNLDELPRAVDAGHAAYAYASGDYLLSVALMLGQTTGG